MIPVSNLLLRVLPLAAALLLPAARALRAESSISYKYADYQELGGRIAVQTQGAIVEQDFGPDTHLRLMGVLDALAGATPTGQPAPAGSDQVPLSNLTEYRKAWNADLARQFPRSRVSLGVANSRESDYVSNGWSINATTDFNQKNTSLLTGIAGTQDTVKVFHQPVWAGKRTNDLIVGVTQLLDPRTSISFNLAWGQSRGHLSDPYKLVQKTTEIFPGVSLPLTFAENRPGRREKWIARFTLNRAFPRVRGAVEASYRHYHDTFDTTAGTVELAWFQRVSEQLLLQPSFRFYDQGAARFYTYDLNRTAIVPQTGAPNPAGPFYSSDYRLSAFQSHTYGFKLIWNPVSALRVDAGWEWYEMRGTDNITPASAYSRARILTVGVSYNW